MPRKIAVVMEVNPVVANCETTEDVSSHPVYLPSNQEDNIDYELIEERETEIDELLIEFVSNLMGTNSPEDQDVVFEVLSEELESLKDEFEAVLADHGITIYRPTTIERTDGIKVMINSIYE